MNIKKPIIHFHPYTLFTPLPKCTPISLFTPLPKSTPLPLFTPLPKCTPIPLCILLPLCTPISQVYSNTPVYCTVYYPCVIHYPCLIHYPSVLQYPPLCTPLLCPLSDPFVMLGGCFLNTTHHQLLIRECSRNKEKGKGEWDSGKKEEGLDRVFSNNIIFATIKIY